MIQLLPEGLLVLTALILLGLAAGYEAKRGKAISSSACSAIAGIGVIGAAVALWWMPENLASGSSMIAMDGLARVLKPVLLGLGLLAILLPPARDEIQNPGEYVALMLFALTGLMLTTGTNHLLFLFVALELASLSLYLLAGFSRTAKSAEAALKYFLFGGGSAAFFLFGLSLIYGFSNVSTLPELADALDHGSVSMLAIAGLAMVVVGVCFKLAAAPFHYWAPDVYQGAPAPSVAMVSAASKVVGVVVLVRVLMTGFGAVAGSASWGQLDGGWSLWLAILAAVSMILGNGLALAQKSVRRLLAYSAVANAGYLLVGLSSNGTAAAGAAIYYVVVYGVSTLGALTVTAAVERDSGSDEMLSFAGLIQRAPLQAVALLVFLASLAGIPPMAGFAGKFALFSGALAGSTVDGNPGLVWLVGLAVIMSAVSLYYYLKVLKQAFVREGVEQGVAAALPWTHRLAMGISAVAVVVMGVLPALLLEPICAGLRALVE